MATSQYNHLRDLLKALYDRKAAEPGAPSNKSAMADAMGISRKSLHLWFTEGEWWSPPGPANLSRMLEFFGATPFERDMAWVLRGRCEPGSGRDDDAAA